MAECRADETVLGKANKNIQNDLQVKNKILKLIRPTECEVDLSQAKAGELLPDNKGVRVDVECTDEDGTRFVVEMQLSEQCGS